MTKKRTKKLKMFVWQGVLCDYTSGMICAAAYDAEHARRLVIKKSGGLISSGEIAAEPTVVKQPRAFWVYGGG